jgi:hypothetical protein
MFLWRAGGYLIKHQISFPPLAFVSTIKSFSTIDPLRINHVNPKNGD